MYNDFSEVYDRLIDADYSKFVSYYNKIFDRFLGKKPELLLDLGCGTGSLTSLLKKDGYDMIGVDASYDMLMRAYALGYTGANMADVMYFIRLDEGTYQRRKYCYRLNECIVKFRGFSKLGLMPKGILYAIKPLIVGLIPIKLLNNLKKRYYET